MEKEFKYEDFKNVYTSNQINAIKAEFTRLKGTCYLDHAGATLYSEKQIQNIFAEYNGNLFGNPHAKNSSSKLTEDTISQIRYELLDHFGTNEEEYSIIFTASATAALKLVAETFSFENGDGTNGIFAYLEDNHTSVLGMREYAENILPLPCDKAYNVFNSEMITKSSEEINNLFIYPAQSNFSGMKYPMSWIKKVHNGVLNRYNEGRWFCLLDAASYASTNVLDLTKYKPDFVPISFYKIFGYPTGLGALIIKNSSAVALKKKYFGGGTVLLAISSENTVYRRKILHENFEDGTVSFLSILALKHGLDVLKKLHLSMDLVSKHVFNLAQYVYYKLLSLHHANGNPAVILYHDSMFENVDFQGGIVNFNLLRFNGEYIGYAEVLHISNLYDIHLRTGCFCNPGACRYYLKLSAEDVKHHYNQGHVCGDQNDLIDGYPTGSIRISFGYMSTKEDADKLLHVIEDCFVLKPSIKKLPFYWNELSKNYFQFKKKSSQQEFASVDLNLSRNKSSNYHLISNSQERVSDGKRSYGTLERVFIYPIKSCAPYSVNSFWELVPTGLKYDRLWMIVNASGVCMTQKNNPYMCIIKPEINPIKDILTLNFEGLCSISIPLDLKNYKSLAYSCHSKVCGDHVEAWDCGNDISEWLFEALNISGLRLLRQCSVEENVSRVAKDSNSQLSFANKAQFLLINSASIQWLLSCLPEEEQEDADSLILRFRPNFVVKFEKEFLEKEFTYFKLGNIILKNDGACTRCQMICIDQTTGRKSVEPLRTLAREFKGKIAFGLYLKRENATCDKIIVNSIVNVT